MTDPATFAQQRLHELIGDEQATGPLAGLLVADLSRVLAGPYCSMLLADMGATVVKVEGAGGDDTRTWMPPEKDGVSTYFLSINRNKRSVVLDFKDADDVALVRELLRRADVAIENFKHGTLSRFGLDYESARALNPGIVYLSITGFGTHGGAAIPGYDLVVQAVSGLMSLTGEPDGPALRAGIPVFDVMTGLHGTVGVLAALQHRAATGEGQHVEVNLLSSAMSGLVNHTTGFTSAGVVPWRMGKLQVTTSSSARCVRCSISHIWPTTHGFVSTPIAQKIEKSCDHSS